MRILKRSMMGLAIGAVLVGIPPGWVLAADGGASPEPKELQAVLDKAANFLRKQQNEDGSFAPKIAGPGVSALVAAALLRSGHGTDEPLVARTLGYLETMVHKDGGIYDKRLANYTTSVALMAFAEANKNGKYDAILKNGARYLKSLQFDDSTVEEKDPKFGGVGYDGKQRPDLSNTQYFLDALMAAGVSKDDPAVQRALKFVGRCQNLAGEFNDQPFAAKASEDDKGGFVYNPNDPEKSPFKTEAGGLRSTAGMTYAGLKSFLHAGVSRDDPRLKAALSYIRRHYTLDQNPGMGQAGLYYYYHTFAKAMSALGEDTFVDAAGNKHDWRKELFAALKKRQREDGSWVNEKDRFGENNPDLATAFAVLTLSYCRPAKR